MKSFKSILDKLDIDEKLTKPIRNQEKIKTVHKVKYNVPNKEDYNFMADLLFLPTTEGDFKYCLTVVDLATDEFDLEPLKSKESEEVLEAMETIFSRKWLNKPYASIRVDDGKEFQGVFKKWMYDESILLRPAGRARHSQISNVESLNRQLGRLFNGYMNTKEIKSGKVNRDWISAVPIVRKELNEFRRKTKQQINKIKAKTPDLDLSKEAKFHIGDLVYRKLDSPENALGEKQSGTFREGDYRFDRQPRKIEKIVYYNGGNPYRYILNGLERISFLESQLMEADEEEELFEVKQLLKKKNIDGKPHYLTWYYNEYKKDASWQPETELIKFVPNIVKEFNEKPKKKPKKK